jgi:hypothetical protein
MARPHRSRGVVSVTRVRTATVSGARQRTIPAHEKRRGKEAAREARFEPALVSQSGMLAAGVATASAGCADFVN